ncbi:hypothetical protein QVD17_28162 [Tagetes erecta]|uniref:Uncharacterized protein n=1 Tax=Tagetes erecta TaxID=13708 RepID=A0AAD8KDA9_TARER|nr:hypothetical protein QVD17_28162 [Tagetes erecta]
MLHNNTKVIESITSISCVPENFFHESVYDICELLFSFSFGISMADDIHLPCFVILKPLVHLVTVCVCEWSSTLVAILGR